MKCCTQCGIEQSLEAFCVRHRSHDGLNSECRSCANARYAVYRREHAQELKVKKAAYNRLYQPRHNALQRGRRQNNIEVERLHERERMRRWRMNHSDEYRGKAREYMRQWRSIPENAKKHLACVQRWQKANPESARDINLRHQAKRRAQKVGASIGIINRKHIYRRDAGRCHLCQRKVNFENFVLDHLVPLALGGAHTEWNLAVACPRCNSRKGAGRLPSQLRLAC